MSIAIKTDRGQSEEIEFEPTYPNMKLKVWFADKNGIPHTPIAGIIKETEKAVMLAIAKTDRCESFLAVWVPKSCVIHTGNESQGARQ